MKLYEIDSAIAAIFEAMTIDEETGEVVLDTEALEQLQEERKTKLENAGLYVKDLEAMVSAIKAEEKALASRRQAMENKAGRIREWIAFNLGDETVDTPRIRMKRSAPRKVTVIDDPYEIRRWLVTEIIGDGWETMNEEQRAEYAHIADLLAEKEVAPQYSKTGLKKLIDEGYQITGVHIEESKPGLLIK